MTSWTDDVPRIIEEADHGRVLDQRRRARFAWGISAVITVVWLVYVTAAGHWSRVLDNVVASITMVFGSLVAGMTPQGGGAVAFPIFTKVIEVPPEVARSFSLLVQAVGMGTAALAIVVRRRPVEWRAVAVGVPFALTGFLVGLYVLGDRGYPFWPTRVPAGYVKVTFTIVVLAMATVVALEERREVIERRRRIELWSPSTYVFVAFAGLLGGVAASMVGSGTDVAVYIFVTIIIGVSPRVGIPTSVVIMGVVSVIGLIVIGVVEGHLAVNVSDAGVTAIGDRSVMWSGGELRFGVGPAAPARQFDLFGMWIAAIPVVAWGAPLGSLLAARLPARILIRIVVTLAALEVLTTILFLDDLRSNVALTGYFIAASLIVIGGILALRRLGVGQRQMRERVLDTEVADVRRPRES